jgi:erythrocyte band 7 integral membrane protein
MKTVVLNLRPQTVITKDNVSLRIDTVVYYRTINPYKLVYKLGNSPSEVYNFISEMSYSAMRTVVGETLFQELLENRGSVADAIEGYVKQSVGTWGLYIENIFIKDLLLSEETKKNVQSAAIQKRVSEATIISAKADVEAAKLLKETSEILNSQSAMQIRYLEAVQNIISSQNSKTMFVSLRGK